MDLEARVTRTIASFGPARRLRWASANAWLIQKSDERFGVVCGHHHGVSGDYLKRRHGHGWHVLTNSGAVQLAFSVCKKAHH